jgi:hypothetical protein
LQALAVYVANRLGGAAHEEQLSEAYLASSGTLKDPGRCVILLLGSLQLGTSRHRGLLFKALADDMGMTCMLIRGRGYGPAAARAAAGGLGVFSGEGSSRQSQGRLQVTPGYEGLSAFVCVQVGSTEHKGGEWGRRGFLVCIIVPWTNLHQKRLCSMRAQCVHILVDRILWLRALHITFMFVLCTFTLCAHRLLV